jgi:hypothetical protein
LPQMKETKCIQVREGERELNRNWENQKESFNRVIKLPKNKSQRKTTHTRFEWENIWK